MSLLKVSAVLILLAVATLALSVHLQGESSAQNGDGVSKGDIDKLYELARSARTELDALRKEAGIPRKELRRRRGEHDGHREGRGEHGEGSREGRGEHDGEGRGEHGEGGEEGGKRLSPRDTWNATRNGAHLILAYNAETRSFQGTVKNTSSKTLSQVRVEVHLSNGVELGPTKRIDLKPGAKTSVELSAANQKFTWWTTHPEHGSEEGHGAGHEGERGEHGGNRPKDASLRPLYNELQLLREEIKMLAEGMKKQEEE
jgi:hypothetical protein